LLEDFGAIWHRGQFLLALLLLYQGLALFYPLTSVPFHHGQFAWLHRLSALIIQIDELLHDGEPVTAEAMEAIDSDIHTLLSPDELDDEFAMKYNRALQRHPDVVLAHADVVMLLTSDSI
jgi:hypothetical protein